MEDPRLIKVRLYFWPFYQNLMVKSYHETKGEAVKIMI